MLPFGIGFGELVIIALVLLLVVGPKDLPKIAQEVGKNVRKARRMLAQIQDSAEVAGASLSGVTAPKSVAPGSRRAVSASGGGKGRSAGTCSGLAAGADHNTGAAHAAASGPTNRTSARRARWTLSAMDVPVASPR